jgi:hypothetical protein
MSPQRISGGKVKTRTARLSRVSRVLPGVEKRLVLNHLRYPEPRLGDGADGFGLQVSSIIDS